jgi:hypothetical protein
LSLNKGCVVKQQALAILSDSNKETHQTSPKFNLPWRWLVNLSKNYFFMRGAEKPVAQGLPVAFTLTDTIYTTQPTVYLLSFITKLRFDDRLSC